MIFDATDKEYIAPSVVVMDVACEAGFKNSTGLSFDDGEDGGWFYL